jgi:hypothetical protein
MCYKSHFRRIRLLLLLEPYMFRPNWSSSGVQVVGETTAPLSRCYTLHFKGVKYLQNILKYHATIIFLYARVVHIPLFYHCSSNVTYILLVCWFSLVLHVAVLNILCSWFCFYIRCRVCALLTGVHFQQCSEYWVMFITVSFVCKLFFYLFCICGIFLIFRTLLERNTG